MSTNVRPTGVIRRLIPRLNPKRGFAMMLDIRVPIGTKLLALLAGMAITALLMAIEAPIELLFLGIPGIGLLTDGIVDCSEALLAPAVIACILLPHMLDRKSRFVVHAEETLPTVEE